MDKHRPNTTKEKVDAMWLAAVGMNGDGMIKKLNNFFDNVAPQLMTKDDCAKIRSMAEDCSDKVGRWIERLITLALLVFVFLFGTGVL